MLNSFGQGLRICVFGASGGIGSALVQLLVASPEVGVVYAGSRTPLEVSDAKTLPFAFDLEDEASIERAALMMAESGELDLIIVATGLLQDGAALRPEKSWRAQTPEAYARAFAINAIGPAIIGKHFLGLLRRDRKAVFAALSAKVGSISDNRLGGWHAYRASKAALNMIVRNFALEIGIGRKQAVVVALHPGTVATALSAPFRSAQEVSSPETAAQHLLGVIDQLSPQDSGQLFSWDGSRIDF
jgi:NAD(P)-dependent dehydrogenase (short-subunit alcohol dehydrogenase family)